MFNLFKKPSLEFMQIPSWIKWPKNKKFDHVPHHYAVIVYNKNDEIMAEINEIQADCFIPEGYKEDKQLNALIRRHDEASCASGTLARALTKMYKEQIEELKESREKKEKVVSDRVPENAKYEHLKGNKMGAENKVDQNMDFPMLNKGNISSVLAKDKKIRMAMKAPIKKKK